MKLFNRTTLALCVAANFAKPASEEDWGYGEGYLDITLAISDDWPSV